MKLITKFEKLLSSGKAKKLLVSLLIGITTVGYASEYSEKAHSEISQSIVRFHVIANSDSERDQQLKLKVRDAVVACLEESLSNINDVEETKAIINAGLDIIQDAAQRVLISNGCNDSVKVETGVFSFPTKVYNGTKLPAGEYYALRVTIGEGNGKNWWSILYPDLCPGISEEQKLKNVLTEDAYNIVTDSDGNIEFKFKFRLLELFGK